MRAVEAGAVGVGQVEREADWDDAFAGVLADLDGAAPAGVGRATGSLRCVSSGYLAEECSCAARVPRAIVTAAWERELARGHGEGFFRFAWQEEVWLAYGVCDGAVRGVYCPAHGAERDRREHSAQRRVPPPPHA